MCYDAPLGIRVYIFGMIFACTYKLNIVSVLRVLVVSLRVCSADDTAVPDARGDGLRAM